MCAVALGSWAGQRPSLEDYVTLTWPTDPYAPATCPLVRDPRPIGSDAPAQATCGPREVLAQQRPGWTKVH